jgi:hypothetical protein
MELAKLEQQALTWPERAAAIKIIDQESYSLAGSMIEDINTLIKGISAEKDPLCKSAHDTWKRMVADRKRYLDPPEEAQKLLRLGCKQFERHQEMLLQEEQRRVDAERQRLEAEDRERRLAEAKAAQAVEAARIAEIRAREEAERLATATTFEDLDTPVFAVPELPPVEAFIAPPAPIAATIAAPTFDRTKGLGIRTTWECRVTSVRQLAKAVADGTVPESYMTPNNVALNARARSDKNEMRIPGCVAVEK